MIRNETFSLRHELDEGRATLATLNSLTKYPSIETYHEIGAKGVLKEFVEADHPAGLKELPAVARFVGGVEITEKVDGTNARLIIMPDGMVLVGSREELLWATGDLIHNPAQGIVDTLAMTGVLVCAWAQLARPDEIRVIYGEVYGDGVGPAGKFYSAGQKGLTGFRVFDVARVPLEALIWSPEQAASWRQHGGQEYETSAAVHGTASYLGVERVPALATVLDTELPKTLDATLKWLTFQAPFSRVGLAQREDGPAKAEGVVLRGFDKSGKRLLAKVRFEDYLRTQKALAKTAAPKQRPASKPLARKLPDWYHDTSAGTA